MRFRLEITGSDPECLAELCQRFVDGLWILEHCTPEPAAAFALDQFRRSIVSRLEALTVTCDLPGPAG